MNYDKTVHITQGSKFCAAGVHFTPPSCESPAAAAAKSNRRILPIIEEHATNTTPSSPSFWKMLCTRISPNTKISKTMRVKIQEDEIEPNSHHSHFTPAAAAAAQSILNSKFCAAGVHIEAAENNDIKSSREKNNSEAPTPAVQTPTSPPPEEKSKKIDTKLLTVRFSVNRYHNETASERTRSNILHFHKRIAPIKFNSMSDNDISDTIYNSYPLFHIKDAKITPDYRNMVKETWQLILDDTKLQYFNHLKNCNLLSMSKTAVSWFYDMFYNSVYSYDTNNKSNMVDIFKNNLKIQARALIVIIENCISVAEKYSVGQKYDFTLMHKTHDKIGVKYKHYIIIFEILLITFKNCLKEQWKNEMELAWCNLISLILKNIYPHYMFQHLCSNIRHTLHST